MTIAKTSAVFKYLGYIFPSLAVLGFFWFMITDSYQLTEEEQMLKQTIQDLDQIKVSVEQQSETIGNWIDTYSASLIDTFSIINSYGDSVLIEVIINGEDSIKTILDYTAKGNKTPKTRKQTKAYPWEYWEKRKP